MFSRMGSDAFKKDLHNIRVLCDALGNPQENFKTIHIGGTNGKGSVSHMLAAIFQTSGYATGLYTSPHLYDFRERIRINGALANKDFVVDFIAQHRELIEKTAPSFFEITVAMAFAYFDLHKVDVAIIEVGLGGRLDSTNIVNPELSIITNIGWDHMNMLGDSLEAIAFEKAGIIKPGVPVLIGEKTEQTSNVFQNIAAERNAPLYFAADLYETAQYHWENNRLVTNVRNKQDSSLTTFHLDLPGIYQTKNTCTVLAATTLLNQSRQWKTFSLELISKALEKVRPLTGLHGRWETVQRNPQVVLEVAHNKEGITEMLRHIAMINFNQLHIIIGMVKDKDIETVLQILPADANYYFTQAQLPRALASEILKDAAAVFSLKGQAYSDVNVALQHAIALARPDDLIIVCGSIFLVAEVAREVFG